MTLNLVVKSPHYLALEVEIEIYLEIAGAAGVAPYCSRSGLFALARHAQERLGLRLVQTDQAIRIASLDLAGLDLRRLCFSGTHEELMAAGGRYHELYRDWTEQAAA